MLSLLQWNMRGYSQKRFHLEFLLNKTKAVCACLQEMKLSRCTLSKFPLKDNFNLVTCECYSKDIGAGSAAIVVKKDATFTKMGNGNANFCKKRQHAAIIRLDVDGTTYTICSIYLPPGNNLDTKALQSLLNSLPEPFIVLGDFNGRHQVWHDSISNTRGRKMARLFWEKNLTMLNTYGPTHVCPVSSNDSKNMGASEIETCLDLSLVSRDTKKKLNGYSWKTDTFLHKSDHFPIHVLLKLNQ